MSLGICYVNTSGLPSEVHFSFHRSPSGICALSISMVIRWTSDGLLMLDQTRKFWIEDRLASSCTCESSYGRLCNRRLVDVKWTMRKTHIWWVLWVTDLVQLQFWGRNNSLQGPHLFRRLSAALAIDISWMRIRTTYMSFPKCTRIKRRKGSVSVDTTIGARCRIITEVTGTSRNIKSFFCKSRYSQYNTVSHALLYWKVLREWDLLSGRILPISEPGISPNVFCKGVWIQVAWYSNRQLIRYLTWTWIDWNSLCATGNSKPNENFHQKGNTFLFNASV